MAAQDQRAAAVAAFLTPLATNDGSEPVLTDAAQHTLRPKGKKPMFAVIARLPSREFGADVQME